MTHDAASPRRWSHASFGRARNSLLSPAAMRAATFVWKKKRGGNQQGRDLSPAQK
jgi:hypothetical protein